MVAEMDKTWRYYVTEPLLGALLVLVLGVWVSLPAWERAIEFPKVLSAPVISSFAKLQSHSEGAWVIVEGKADASPRENTLRGFVVWHRKALSGGTRYSTRTWDTVDTSTNPFFLRLGNQTVRVGSGYRLIGHLQRLDETTTEYLEGIVSGQTVLVYGRLPVKSEVDTIDPEYIVAGSKDTLS